jgi:uncharacterized protein YqhQ
MAKFYYGGQAVIEGVMMRGRKTAAVAVRQPSGSIYLHEEALDPKLFQNPWFRLPFLRGILMLWEMLVLGTRLMMLASNIAMGIVPTEAETPTTNRSEGQPLASDSASEQPDVVQEQEKPVGKGAMILMVVLSLAFAVAIFFVSPLLVVQWMSPIVGEGWLSLLIEGLIRLVLLIGYIALIGLMPDIQRVFGYHGAEHKAINALEQGDPLDVEHVRKASRLHTRCGTGFLLMVAVISIIVFAFIGSPLLIVKVLGRILLLPVVAGIAYELLRLGAANYRYRVVRWLLTPSFALQGLTTREPDDSMIECAIASLQSVVDADAQDAVPADASVPAAAS